MILKPVGKKILVRPLERVDEKYKESEIIMPGAVAKLLKGVVVAHSDEIKSLYAEGTVVLFHENKGIGQPLNGEMLLWLDTTTEKEEIWAIVTE